MNFEVVFTVPVNIDGEDEIRVIMFNTSPRTLSPKGGNTNVVSIPIYVKDNVEKILSEHAKDYLEEVYDQFNYRIKSWLDLKSEIFRGTTDCVASKLTPIEPVKSFFSIANLLTPPNWSGDTHLVRIHFDTGIGIKPKFSNGKTYTSDVVYNRHVLFEDYDNLPFTDPYFNILLFDDLVRQEFSLPVTGIKAIAVYRSVENMSRVYRQLQVKTLSNALDKSFIDISGKLAGGATTQSLRNRCECAIRTVMDYWTEIFKHSRGFSELKPKIDRVYETHVFFSIDGEREYIENGTRRPSPSQWNRT